MSVEHHEQLLEGSILPNDIKSHSRQRPEERPMDQRRGLPRVRRIRSSNIVPRSRIHTLHHLRQPKRRH